jgi:hypothetical protein
MQNCILNDNKKIHVEGEGQKNGGYTRGKKGDLGGSRVIKKITLFY